MRNFTCPNCKKEFKDIAGFFRKLTDEDIETAKDLIKNGFTYRQIGRIFKVNPCSIWERVNGRKRNKVKKT